MRTEERPTYFAVRDMLFRAMPKVNWISAHRQLVNFLLDHTMWTDDDSYGWVTERACSDRVLCEQTGLSRRQVTYFFKELKIIHTERRGRPGNPRHINMGYLIQRLRKEWASAPAEHEIEELERVFDAS